MPCRGRGILTLLLVGTTAATPVAQAEARQPSPAERPHHEEHQLLGHDAPERDEKRKLISPAPPPPLPPSPAVPPPETMGREGTALSLSVACGVLLLAILVQQSLRGSLLAGLLTDTGSAIIIGAGFNLAFWVVTSLYSGRSNGQLSIALSPTLHDIIYFGLLPPIIFEVRRDVHSEKRHPLRDVCLGLLPPVIFDAPGCERRSGDGLQMREPERRLKNKPQVEEEAPGRPWLAATAAACRGDRACARTSLHAPTATRHGQPPTATRHGHASRSRATRDAAAPHKQVSRCARSASFFANVGP